MLPPEPRYPTTINPENSKTADTQEKKYFKSYIMKMIGVPKEKLNKSLKKSRQISLKEINKTVQDLKLEIEATNETQNKGILEMEKSG